MFETFMAVFLVGLFTPVFSNDWGKCSIISLGIVLTSAVVWLVTGWLTVAVASLCFAGGLETGFRVRRYYLIQKLRDAVTEQSRILKKM
jgi:hypothetical protein